MRALRIVVTDRCNLRCSYCYNEGNRKPLENNYTEIELSVIEYVIKCLKTEISEVVITGGEPLLYSHINELIVLLHNLNYPFRITTNGIEVNKFFGKREYEYINKFNISIDRFEPNSFRESTSTSSTQYYKLLENIKRILNDKKELCLNTIVDENRNQKDIENFIIKAYEMGINMIKFLPLIGQKEKIVINKIKKAIYSVFKDIIYVNSYSEIDTFKCNSMVFQIVHQYCNNDNCFLCKRNSFYRLNCNGCISTCLEHRFKEIDVKKVMACQENLFLLYKKLEEEVAQENNFVSGA